MDSPEFPSGRSPRRELQGPRPTPLKVSKDSHKIRKPPVAPQAPAPPKPPVIIYTVSPKIIHAKPNEFMSLVQRLTGPESSYTGDGTVSPAARFASIERTRSPDGRRNTQVFDRESGLIRGVEFGSDLERIGQQFPGILSPNPNSLPPIPISIFTPPSDQQANPLNFIYDFSPVLLSNRGYPENIHNFNAFPSPNFFSPQINMNSPNTVDLFRALSDL